MSTCGAKSCIGSICIEPEGHDGPHRSEYGSSWTEESDRAYGAAIARSMDGRRD